VNHTVPRANLEALAARVSAIHDNDDDDDDDDEPMDRCRRRVARLASGFTAAGAMQRF
jgi:hypothetical protein